MALRVAHERDVDRVVAADPVGVDVDLHERLRGTE